MRVKMVALKSMRYRTRRMRAGDEFVATRHAARIFKAVGRADVCASRSKAKKAVAEPAPDPRDDLRAEYEAVSGSQPDGRWSAARLRSEIDNLRNEIDNPLRDGGEGDSLTSAESAVDAPETANPEGESPVSVDSEGDSDVDAEK